MWWWAGRPGEHSSPAPPPPPTGRLNTIELTHRKITESFTRAVGRFYPHGSALLFAFYLVLFNLMLTFLSSNLYDIT